MVLLEQYTAYSVSVSAMQRSSYLVQETQPNEVVGLHFSRVYNHLLIQGLQKKMVGKLNRYNFCSMPDRKFYPSSF